MIKLSDDMNNRSMDEMMSDHEVRKRQLDAPEPLPPRKRQLQCAGDTTSSTSTSTVLDGNTIRPNVPHGDEELHRQARKEVLAQIEARLEPHSCCKTSLLAQALEKSLYKNARSFEAYADRSTLDSRVRLAAVAFFSRRCLHQGPRNGRRQALEKALGSAKYGQVCDLVKAVQELRMRGAALCRCTSCCPKQNKVVTVIPGAQRAIQPAVRNLFFGTPLIEAFQSAALDKVLELDWDTMIHQARDNIDAFQAWSGLGTSHYTTE